MIEQAIKKWHSFVKTGQVNILDELLADDVEFYSPVVFKPQYGKAITKMYLATAAATFSAGKGALSEDNSNEGIQNFHYTKEVLMDNYAILEFESELEGVYINGVDIITFNENGQITEFKVMMRPIQAVNAMHQQMKMMLNRD
ncbi:MAG: hypothetical protein ACI9N9_002683 [Enterobacterales bacterium]|jgi:hypothetical protein